MARRFSGSSVSKKMKLYHSWWFLPLYLHCLWHFLNNLIYTFLYTSGFIWCYFDRLWCWLLVQHLFLYVCRVLKSLPCIIYIWKALYVVGNEVVVYISGSGLRCRKSLNTLFFVLNEIMHWAFICIYCAVIGTIILSMVDLACLLVG